VTHGDLFAGIGGFALAARWCGIKTIWAVEIDPYCQAVYRKHFPDVEMYGDVKQIVADTNGTRQLQSQRGEQDQRRRTSDGNNERRILPSVDLLTGGFPCQPFSVAGKRRGTADDRYLWPEMLRIIRAVHPRLVIAENVPGIDDATHMVLDTVTSDLERIGYATIPIEIPACAVGAPHRRQRVWVVANAISRGCVAPREQRGLGAMARSGSDHTMPTKESNSCESPDQEREPNGSRGRLGFFGLGSGDVADAEQRFADWWPRGTSWWSREPAETLQDAWGDRGEEDGFAAIKSQLGRVAHGIPARVDRLRALGNAIVPQVAEKIMRAILESEP